MVPSRWDLEKHGAQKVTNCHLKKITPGGLVLQKHVDVIKRIERGSITVKEYEATHFLIESNWDIIDMLKNNFPNYWKEIFLSTVFSLIRNSTKKNLELLNASSFISDALETNTSDKRIGIILRSIVTEIA